MMIRLIRPEKPNQLTDSVQEELTKQYSEDTSRRVWSKSYIKESLLAMSHNKCAYCECSIVDGIDMHIDHFYPKSLYPQLVVDWNNLMPACPHCNRNKKDVDPIRTPIINPTKEDPKEYFYLKDYRYMCKHGQDDMKAKNTIGIFTLNDMHCNVSKRYQLGNSLHEKINDIANKAILYAEAGCIDIVSRNQIRNSCRDILLLAQNDSQYTAFMATIIFHDEEYSSIKSVLCRIGEWDEELEQLEVQARLYMFDECPD